MQKAELFDIPKEVSPLRILKKDLRHNTVVLVPENPDDLWLISEIVGKGDIVGGKTLRSIKIERGDTHTSVRKSIFVRVSVEKVDFEESQLRASGRIIECSEGERGWHAFEIMPNESVSIEREWKKYELQRLDDAKVKHPKVLICVMDDGEADFFVLTEKLQPLASFRGVTGKTYGQENREKYYGELVKYMQDKDCFRIILAGPGFAKDDLMKLVKETGGSLASKIIMDGIAHTGEAGVRELLRRGIVEKLVKSSAVAEQTRLVEKFFSELAADGKVMYGPKEVENAVEMGAVSMLLVSDKLVREKDSLLKTAESRGAEVKIIYSNHEAGERLLSMGGLAAFLRYKIGI